MCPSINGKVIFIYTDVIFFISGSRHVETILSLGSYMNIIPYHKICTYSFNCFRSINVHSEHHIDIHI